MNNYFCKQINKGNCIIYIDDILIMERILKELWRNTVEIFKVLKQNNLYVKSRKCKFKQKEVTFLGYIVLRRTL